MQVNDDDGSDVIEVGDCDADNGDEIYLEVDHSYASQTNARLTICTCTRTHKHVNSHEHIGANFQKIKIKITKKFKSDCVECPHIEMHSH